MGDKDKKDKKGKKADEARKKEKKDRKEEKARKKEEKARKKQDKALKKEEKKKREAAEAERIAAKAERELEQREKALLAKARRARAAAPKKRTVRPKKAAAPAADVAVPPAPAASPRRRRPSRARKPSPPVVEVVADPAGAAAVDAPEPLDEPLLDEPEDAPDTAEEIEARLDRILRRSMQLESSEPRPASVLDSARELLTSDYYLRVWGQLGMRGRSLDVDEYGLDPKVEANWQPLFDFLYRTYWRVEVSGVEHVPPAGRCLLVANHSGVIPWDGAMIKTAVLREHAARRSVRWLAEDFVFHFPFVGAFMNRVGAVRACQENAERMLRQERLVAVFPEGILGIGKLYRERYHLQRFGRGGYIKLVLRTGAPIVPVAVVGAEEIHPLLFRGRTLANLVGMPYVPVTPTFPWLGPLGLVPLPSRWMIRFGEPIRLDEYGPEAADDSVVVNRLNDQVRAQVQAMVDELLVIRKGAA